MLYLKTILAQLAEEGICESPFTILTKRSMKLCGDTVPSSADSYASTEAEKLYNKLVNDLTNTVVCDMAFNNNDSTS
jgi:hypothetical protein